MRIISGGVNDHPQVNFDAYKSARHKTKGVGAELQARAARSLP
jgi:hypothetical protein